MSVTHKLLEPITYTLKSSQGERVETTEEVTIRCPKAKDMRVVDRHTGQVAQGLAMIAQLTGLTAAEVDEMGVADVTAIGGIIEGFMEPGLPIGAIS